MEMNLKSSSRENPEVEAEVEDSMRFDKSLKELRELRSQLHHAAEYCETKFLNSKEKSVALENTKGYICRTVVTVVDHLGNVSANLEGLISQTNAFSEAELRIQCLKQRLLSCEQYADTLTLTKMQWSENLPRFHSRYLSSPPTLERLSKEKLRDSAQVAPKVDDKLVPATQEFRGNLKQTTATVKGHNNLGTVVPARDGLKVLAKVPHSTFHFQSTQKVGRHRRSLHGSNIFWRMRRSKQTQ